MNRLASPVALAAFAFAAGGCNLLLGLNEFTNETTANDGGGGQGGQGGQGGNPHGGSAPNGGGGATGGPVLVFDPSSVAFGPLKPGDAAPARPVKVKNVGDAKAGVLAAAALGGPDAADFTVEQDGCAGKRLDPQDSCTISLSFVAPAEPFDGARHATLALGSSASAAVTGVVRHWVEETFPDAPVQLNAVYAASSSNIFAVGAAGTVLHSKGDGSWETQSTPIGNQDLNAVFGGPNGHIYAAGQGINLIHQPPSSTGWTAVAVTAPTMTTANAIWGAPPGSTKQMFVLGDGGKALSFAEGSTAINTLATGLPYTMYAATGWFSADVLHTTGAGENDALVYYSDAAGAFEQNDVLVPATVVLRGVFEPDASGKRWAVGTHGAIWEWVSGLPKRAMSAPMVDYFAVWGPSATEIYVVGENGTILRGDGAQGFTAEPSHTTKTLRGVYGAGGNIYAVGDRVILRRLQ